MMLILTYINNYHLNLVNYLFIITILQFMNLVQNFPKSIRMSLEDPKLTQAIPLVPSSQSTRKLQLEPLKIKSTSMGLNLKPNKKVIITDSTEHLSVANIIKTKTVRRMSAYQEKQNITARLLALRKANKAEEDDEIDQTPSNNQSMKIKKSVKLNRNIRINRTIEDRRNYNNNSPTQFRIKAQDITGVAPWLIPICNNLLLAFKNDDYYPLEKSLIINADLFIIQTSLWSQPSNKLRNQTKQILVHLSQLFNVVILFHNKTQFSENFSKLLQLKAYIMAIALIKPPSFTKKTNSNKIYDISELIEELTLPPQLFILDTITPQQSLDPQSLYEQLQFPIFEQQNMSVTFLILKLSRKSQTLPNLQFHAFPDGDITLKNFKIKRINTEEQVINFEDLKEQYHSSIFFDRVSDVKRTNQSETRVKQKQSLQIFKEKLLKYIKILYLQANLNKRLPYSVSYLVGDLVNRNYSIYDQIKSNKLFEKVKHERNLVTLNKYQPSQIFLQEKYEVPLYLLYN